MDCTLISSQFLDCHLLHWNIFLLPYYWSLITQVNFTSIITGHSGQVTSHINCGLFPIRKWRPTEPYSPDNFSLLDTFLSEVGLPPPPTHGSTVPSITKSFLFPGESSMTKPTSIMTTQQIDRSNKLGSDEILTLAVDAFQLIISGNLLLLMHITQILTFVWLCE